MMMKHFVFFTALLALTACSSVEPAKTQVSELVSDPLWRGVDLSYVNELEDCGASFSDTFGRSDPYEIMEAAGANLVRLRLWHNPQWTEYSTLEDVRKSISRARSAGMQVLLDFHYSDDWVHPGKQIIPESWRDAQSDDELAQRLYDYTRETLISLADDGLLPEYVQIGNETNTEMLITEEVAEDSPINWERNVKFLNVGIEATRAVSAELETPIGIMLHIAQPENVEPWFHDAAAAGLHDFDIIGISYYAKWSKMPFSLMEQAIARIRSEFGKDVVIVETAYPWTLRGNDPANNLLGEDSLIAGYPATKNGQRKQLIDLMDAVVSNGGLGVVYWEPAWISSDCSTRWGDGSHWENATLFDFNGRLHRGAEFLSLPYPNPTK